MDNLGKILLVEDEPNDVRARPLLRREAAAFREGA